MAVALEVSDEPSADLRGVHQLLPSSSCAWSSCGRRCGAGGRPPAGRARGSMRHRGRSARATRFPSRPGPGRPRRGTSGRRRLEPAEPVAQAVGGEGLGGAAAAHHGVDPAPAPATNQMARLMRRPRRRSRVGARCRAQVAPGRPEVGTPLLAGALDLAPHLEADPVAGLRRQGAPHAVGQGRRPCTTVSRSTRSANERRGSIARRRLAARRARRSPRWVMTYSARSAAGALAGAGAPAGARCRRPRPRSVAASAAGGRRALAVVRRADRSAQTSATARAAAPGRQHAPASRTGHDPLRVTVADPIAGGSRRPGSAAGSAPSAP